MAKKTDEPKVLHVSFDALTYGDLEALEEAIGVFPVNEDGFDQSAIPKSKMMTAMAFVALRREDPDATLADARGLPVGSVVVGDVADPT